MNQYIEKLLFKLRTEFLIYFVLIVIFAILGFTKVIPNGIFVVQNGANTEYLINVAAIAVSFIAVLSAFKLFRLNTEQNIKRYTLDDAVALYHKWSLVRIILMFLASAAPLAAHFLTLNDTGIFSAVICILLSFIFCIPAKDKIKNYLEKLQQEHN